MTIEDVRDARLADEGQALIEVPKTFATPLRGWMISEAAVKKFQDRAEKARAAFAEAKRLLDDAEEHLRSAKENARFAREALNASIEEHKQ
jgi:hypothetical protein